MQNQQREQQLLKNTGILALGTLCSKVFSFFLLPLYTTALTTEDYGTVDVLQTVAAFILPFVTLELSSGVFRYLIEKNKEDHAKVISSALFIEFINIVVFIVVVNAINTFHPIQYCGIFILYFASHALMTLVQNITRGFGDNMLYSIMSFAMTAIAVVANLILILLMGRKGDSILFAASLSYIGASCISIIRLSLWRYVKKDAFSKELLKEILTYTIPLIPNAISWWVANTSDRLLIRYFLGANYNGIYAAANKIPTIYVNLYNVFNIAWIESLARGVKDPKQIVFINRMFKKSIQLFGCLNLGIICCMSIFFTKLIGHEYTNSYWHIYILLIAIYVNSLCSLLGGIFTSYKRSDIIGNTTVIGAVVNIIVHLALVRFIGLYAASISTLASYTVIMLLRNYHAKKIIPLKWPVIFLLELAGMLGVVTIGYYLKNMVLNSVIFSIVMIWSLIRNKEILGSIVATLKKRMMRS